MRLGGDPDIKSTDFGINIYGVNADVDAAEDIWSGGGDFDWTKVAANATTTIESSDAADDGSPAGTGAQTVEVEGLVSTTAKGLTGGKITRETATLNGTTAVTLTNLFMFVYRVRVLTVGSGGTNAGLLSVKHGTDVIARVEIGANVTESAFMVVPQFTSSGAVIHGAYIHNWYAGTTISTAADINTVLQSALPSTTVWANIRRGVCTIYNDVNQEFHVPPYLAPGSKIRVRATAVSAGNQSVAGSFALEYQVG